MAGSHLNWLSSRERFGVKLGLDSMSSLLAELGNPHIDLPAVLVAGTNGKGSTASMIAAILSAAGRKTLLYTSPHVSHVSERIRLDGRRIRSDSLSRRLAQVRTAVTRLRRSGRLLQQPTYFEVMTAAALLHARACRATAAVFEIGLGGRYDATNVIPAPVAVITSIARDHTEYLGKSLKKIAWNKAGIIKKDQTVLTLESRRELLAVFRAECKRQGASLIPVPARSARRLKPASGSRPGQRDRWDLRLEIVKPPGSRRLPGRLDGVHLGLRGPQQGPQAVLAMMAAATLLDLTPPGITAGRAGRPRTAGQKARPLTAAALRRALAGVHLPGRFEQRLLSNRRLLIADAAHNPAAAELLAQEIRALAGDRHITLLFSALADKDVRAMIQPLLEVVDNVNLSPVKHRRGMQKKDLFDLAGWMKKSGTRRRQPSSSGRSAGHSSSGGAAPDAGPKVFPDAQAAWTGALAATPAGGILLVAGSFYLLGDLWPRISRRPLLT